MNIWALITSLILSWNLSVASTYNLPLAMLLNEGDGNVRVVLESKALDEKVVIPHKKDNKSWGVKITAQAAAVLDEESGLILWQKNANTERSIASITKLMTALVFLQHNPGWETLVTMEASDETHENKANIYRGETVSVKDLFYVGLVASDNNAIKALARSTNLSEADFIKLMNEKAASLGLKDTKFKDTTGLDDANISTATDVLYLAQAAFKDPNIKAATSLSSYSFATQANRQQKAINTNNLLRSYLNITAGKTGSTNAAGYCLVSEIEGDKNQKIITVVLGSETHDQRFMDLKILAGWILDNYEWF